MGEVFPSSLLGNSILEIQCQGDNGLLLYVRTAVLEQGRVFDWRQEQRSEVQVPLVAGKGLLPSVGFQPGIKGNIHIRVF